VAAQRRCLRVQPSLPIAVTDHIDSVDSSLNDGIISHSGESGIGFGSLPRVQTAHHGQLACPARTRVEVADP
jgi:hypothetical protein